jgi:hypothetical protein
MKRIALVTFCLLSACAGSLASGQEVSGSTDGTETNESTVVHVNVHDNVHDYIDSVEGASTGLGDAEEVPLVVEAGQANGKGEITFRGAKCADSPDCWALKLSAPVDKSTDIADFTDLDGLAKDLVIGASRRWLFALDEEKVTALVDSFTDLCEDFAEILEGEECTEWLVDREARSNEALARSWRSIKRKANRLSQAFTLQGKLSYNEYDYFTLNAVEEDTEEYGLSLKGVYSIGVGAGRVSLAVAAQRAYAESKAKARSCAEVEGSETLETCKELPLGPPTRVDSLILQAQYRTQLGPIAVTPLATHDFELDVWGLELPVYLLRDEDKAFTGGIRFGWRSDDDELVGSIFVSKRLSFDGGG